MAEIWTFHRGHACYAEQDKDGVYSIWKYSADGVNIKDKERPCPRCGNDATKDGHDHCIANLKDVKYACCGHGAEDGYVKLNDGEVITFGTHLNRKQIEKLIKDYHGIK